MTSRSPSVLSPSPSHPDSPPDSPRRSASRSSSKVLDPKSLGGSREIRKSRQGSSIMQSLESRNSNKMSTAHIARPDMWALARVVLSEGDDDSHMTESQRLLAKMRAGYTTITHKEDTLEAIMSAEAHASFDCLGRHQMEPGHMFRVCINPLELKGQSSEMRKILQAMGSNDLDAPTEWSLELVNKYGVKQWDAQPGTASSLPHEIASQLGCRFGCGLTVPKGGKTAGGITGAIGDLLMQQGGLKVSSAMAKAMHLHAERGFAARCGDRCLVGIVNAHGHPKLAGQLALLVSQELPAAFFNSPALVKQDDIAKGLTQAFAKAHCSVTMQLDASLTGAAISVVVIDKERIWVAHVGDCRVVLGVPDTEGMSRDFHVSPKPLTEDHKLGIKKEFDRIKEAGGEVRKLKFDNVCRLFCGDSPFPGLMLTRCVGNRLGHSVGVSHKPTVSMLKRQDLAKGTFILMGSAGLWSTVSEATAVNWVSRSFPDPQAAAASLSAEAQNRWEAPGSKAKGNLQKGTTENFGAFMICFDEAAEETQQSFRKFVVGPMTGVPGTPRKPWTEVKTSDRVLELRRMAQSATPRE